MHFTTSRKKTNTNDKNMTISMSTPANASVDRSIHTGRIVLIILLGLAAEGLAFIVIAGCRFIDVQWTDEYRDEGLRTFETTTGVVACRSFGLSGGFGGPTNGIDALASWSAFFGPLAGILGIIHSCATHWYCCCDCCWPSGQGNPHKRAALLFLVASILQLMTLLLLVAPSCSDEYQGNCTLLRNGYFSTVISFIWLLCAALVWKQNNEVNNPEAAATIASGPVSEQQHDQSIAVAVAASTIETEKTTLPDGSTKTRTVVKNADGSSTITEIVETA